MENKSQASSELDIDAEQEHHSPKFPYANKDEADFSGQYPHLAPEISSSDNKQVHIVGELMSQSPKISSFDENEVDGHREHVFVSMDDSSDDNGMIIDGKHESLSPKFSSIDYHGNDTDDELDNLIPEVSPANRRGMDIDHEQECQGQDVPPVDVLVYDHPVKDEAETYLAPELGMEFESEEHAYKCYNRYAALEGFSIRKDFINKSRINGVVVSRRYTCYKQGYRLIKRDANVKRPRKDTRTGCLAHMTVARQPNGKYRVTHFDTKHNHELATPFTAHLLPSQRRINFSEAVEAEVANGSVIDGIPKLGMGFDSEDHAYDFYNAYAGQVGFSVRKDYVNRSKIDGAVASRRFTCFREGFRQNDKREASVKRPRKETRIGCLAQLVIARQPDGKYRVTHFEEHHNHELVPACRVRMLRSQKRSAAMLTLEAKTKDGLKMHLKSPSELLGNPTIEQGDFVYNPTTYRAKLLSKRMKEIGKGEAESILKYFQSKQLKDPSFFYAVQLDAEDQLTNIFWADGKMLVDYGDFGDVVCFDTTYRLDVNCRPFAPFCGVNHHKKMVIFGAALLYDETVESFKWLFQTFVEAMSGKNPKTMLTDQDRVIAEAIDSVLPGTLHRVCIWHVYQDALKHLAEVVVGLDSFVNDLGTCFFYYDEEEDFINAWNAMLEKYGLWENELLNDTFREREKWAVPYQKHIFTADIKNVMLSENVNINLRKYLKYDVDVLQLFKHLGKVVNDWRYKELEVNYDMSQSMPRLMGDVIMLKHARDVYTPTIFELFQQEYENSLNIVVNQCTDSGSFAEYKVSIYEQVREYTVICSFSEDSAVCDCMKFQLVGILCSHALKVLDYRNIKMIPAQYILKRWTKNARV